MDNYYKCLAPMVTYPDLNRSTNLRFVYTPVHGVGAEYMSKAFEFFKLPVSFFFNAKNTKRCYWKVSELYFLWFAIVYLQNTFREVGFKNNQLAGKGASQC